MSARRTPVSRSVRILDPRSSGSSHRSLTTSLGQVGKLLGERWKALSEKQRAPYEAKAAADKKRYEDEKAAYNVSFAPLHLPCSDAELIRTPKAEPADDESS